MSVSTSPAGPGRAVAGRGVLVVAALGIVFGDIGTSPLYTVRECFTQHGGFPINHETVLGALSLMFWALILTVTIKYVVFIMRADNDGEGGILALTALAARGMRPSRRTARAVTLIGLVGAAMFFGDIMITPAMTVLSATEGLAIISPGLEAHVVPLTLAILVFLFVIQRHGTARVGAVFGPLMAVWFLTLAVLGVSQIVREPAVLAAVNPIYGIHMLFNNGARGFLLLGAVVLTITGGEALYADMGHLGRFPIRFAWFAAVLPSLLVNYFGQGALLLRNPAAIENPFFLSAPDWALVPLVILSTVASVIASQAVITGAYSITRQAINMGWLPRMTVMHTSEEAIGQIYVPRLNWILLAGVIGLVLAFRSSNNLAAAYGIAVTGTMVTTTALAYVVARRLGGWSKFRAGAWCALFLVVDLAFLTANLTKVMEGGWFPLAVGLFMLIIMTTWRDGRDLLRRRLTDAGLPVELFMDRLKSGGTQRVPGTGVFLTRDTRILPTALTHSLKHFKVLHQRVVLMTVETADVPHVPYAERCQLRPETGGLFRLTLRFGFKDQPNVPETLERQRFPGLPFDPMETTYVISHETALPSNAPGLARWRKALFIGLSHTATRMSDHFAMPPGRVVELGMRVEI